MKIGAQFFTIRDYCRTPEALDESLKRVADIGYRHIQLSGVCPYEADWMAERLRTYGLSVEITHFDYNRILRDPTGTIRFHDVMGCRWIGIGSNPRGACRYGGGDQAGTACAHCRRSQVYVPQSPYGVCTLRWENLP